MKLENGKEYDITKFELLSVPEFSTKTGMSYTLKYEEEEVTNVSGIEIAIDAHMEINRTTIDFSDTYLPMIGLPKTDIYFNSIRITMEPSDKEPGAMSKVNVYSKDGSPFKGISDLNINIGDANTITEANIVTC
jgi:hypothetical protein